MAFWRGRFTVISISRYFSIPLGAQQLWTLRRAERRTDVARAGASAQRWDMLCGRTKQAARGEISGFCQQRAMVALAGCPGWHTMEMSHWAPTRNVAVRTGLLNHLSLSPAQKEKSSWKRSHGADHIILPQNSTH